jgi:tripeptidyl-peptidase-1
MFASGDSGVHSRQSPVGVFLPDFPASLPAITAVGATQLNADGTETTGTSFSGGGFCLSQYFNRSSDCPYQVSLAQLWQGLALARLLNGMPCGRGALQESAVATFFSTSTTLPSSGLYDSKGCGYPDVSAQGVNFEVRYKMLPTGRSQARGEVSRTRGEPAPSLQVYINGVMQPVSGTSAACPTFAAVVSLLNDQVGRC